MEEIGTEDKDLTWYDYSLRQIFVIWVSFWQSDSRLSSVLIPLMYGVWQMAKKETWQKELTQAPTVCSKNEKFTFM